MLNCSPIFACSGIDFSLLLMYYVFAHRFWKTYVHGKHFSTERTVDDREAASNRAERYAEGDDSR